MPSFFQKTLKSQKGVSIITIIILIAVVVAALNVYAYFEPNFQLKQFSAMYYLRDHNDKIKKADLEKLKAAVDSYYEDHHDYPANTGWCGRIFSLMQTDVRDALSPYFAADRFPQDPTFGNTNKDYFYMRVDDHSYVLMASLENSPLGDSSYNYTGCYDWPGDGIYNYKLTGGY
ncbi:MAG: hypothetical protein A2172_04270 [Candidatus Woykebacteria bacterium RBG_13_40_15]|uniref:Type II secretion system protein GspG C-terminal domain-containing protein n=1 Tax=Candidatus Woykebacteria bacterium RBG_13_40_15 TaxID=1802593 RepID=A0A1G1W6W0_9BACT|nr:MAG: hypothetical protein A2172_04270 [Candidatus Woykebacteria bacterium RBG_13_40_15]